MKLQEFEITLHIDLNVGAGRLYSQVLSREGKRDRYAMLSPALLELLSAWWRHARTTKNVTRRLVVSGPKPGESDVDPPAQSRLSSGAQDRRDRQGGLAAFAAEGLDIVLHLLDVC